MDLRGLDGFDGFARFVGLYSFLPGELEEMGEWIPVVVPLYSLIIILIFNSPIPS